MRMMLAPQSARWRTHVGPARARVKSSTVIRSEEHTSELQSQFHLVCRLLLEKKNSRSLLPLLNFVICRQPQTIANRRRSLLKVSLIFARCAFGAINSVLLDMFSSLICPF